MSYNEEDYKWFVLKVIGGREKSVERSVQEALEREDSLSKLIKNIYVPVQTIVKIKRGKRVKEQKSLFSGYILINMVNEKKLVSILSKVSGVLGFVSSDGMPIPLTQRDVEKMMSTDDNNDAEVKDELEETFESGQRVRIVDGPFASFIGHVDYVDHNSKKLRISVTIFGRSTPVDLECSQVVSEDFED